MQRGVVIVISLALLIAAFFSGYYFKDYIAVAGVNEQGEETNNFVPVVQEYKQDENCPEGQVGVYSFTGAEVVLVECRPIPSDVGRICSTNNDCESKCFTTNEDLIALGCELPSCGKDDVYCEGIKGRCSSYFGTYSFRTIYKLNTVSSFCEH